MIKVKCRFFFVCHNIQLLKRCFVLPLFFIQVSKKLKKH